MHAHDREGLERLCRYGARPPFTLERPCRRSCGDKPAPSRIPWVELVQRAYRADVLRCVRCGGRMAMLAFISER